MEEEIKIDEFGRYYTNIGIYKGIIKYANLRWINSETGNIISTTVSKGKPVPKQEPFVDNAKRPIVDYTNKPIPYPTDFSKDFNITENFSLHELLLWNQYKTRNIPSKEHFDNMIKLCREFLQPIKNKWGKSLKVNSCYRSYKVNQDLKKTGAKPADNSDHCFGAACDLDADNENHELFDMILQMIKNKEIPNCRQIIWEKGTPSCPNWVHIAMNNQYNSKQENNIFSLYVNPPLHFNKKTFEYWFG